MKHLAVALIVVALIAADFLCDLLMAGKAPEGHGWATADSIGLVCATLWFFHHRGPRD